MARIPLISPDSDLAAVQRRVVDSLLGRRGKIPGPYRLSLHCPELTEVWHPLGEALRLKSRFELRISELGILLAARAWDCNYVYHSHGKIAIGAGISPEAVEAMRLGRRPVFVNEDEAAAYDFCMELHDNHKVSDATYARALEVFGVPGVVELGALFGYYSMVSMTMLAHEMDVPADAKPLETRQPK